VEDFLGGRGITHLIQHSNERIGRENGRNGCHVIVERHDGQPEEGNRVDDEGRG
jgi:hypothetical protein